MNQFYMALARASSRLAMGLISVAEFRCACKAASDAFNLSAGK